jgi:hypothetical protein
MREAKNNPRGQGISDRGPYPPFRTDSRDGLGLTLWVKLWGVSINLGITQ